MQDTRRNLPQLLGDARRWFEEGLLAAVEAGSATPVSPTQTQLFAVLDGEGTTVSELARRMGVTRQTAHQAVHSLIAAGLLEQVPDPASARQRLIRRTEEGERAHRRAVRTIEQLEDQLAERIGREAADALRAALEAPWGPPPSAHRHDAAAAAAGQRHEQR
ncbi:MarR family transcriptional regulator [Streptomyces chrestomyceticus JCM 4735]|uniref:MarR family transcriptional regulator n=1 Tax=Streptomyces chrestomyceticus JCM 4735 TaxID=1306181 RepID=A0A7U9PVI9_9ACTN|nr:MarR family winged helix-turn-helix transcriptional regulator [Streptomyces chrestomyceticus]GCD32350.1 MarR family transcriptional regulator [Streptomyces chrestomyceticus JCM 4735]